MKEEEKIVKQKFIDDVHEMVAKILCQIDEMLINEDCDNYIDINEDNATEFFTALTYAVCHKMIRSGNGNNMIQAIGVCNNLLVQYLLYNENIKRRNDYDTV